MNDISRAWVLAILNDWDRPPRRARIARSAQGTASRLHLPTALVARLRGPGGFYNIGNVLGLGMGVAVQLASMPADSAGSGLWAFLAGSPSAAAMTAATAVFLVSGEIYHRAWRSGGPDERLNRMADLLSGVGAILLALALFMLGYPLLAATSGLLGAAGKLGNAAIPRMPRGTWPPHWPDPFRSAVVASRIPAILASAGEVWTTAAVAIAGGPLLPAVTPATLLVCYLLWVRADLLLCRSNCTATHARSPEAGNPSTKS